MDPGFEGIGDFSSDDPWQRYIAHQAAKCNYPREARKVAEPAIVHPKIHAAMCGLEDAARSFIRLDLESRRDLQAALKRLDQARQEVSEAQRDG